MYHGEIVCPETININEFNNLLSLMNVYLIADHKESKNTTDIILCGMFKISKNKKTGKISIYSAELNIDQETRVLTKKWRFLTKPEAPFNIPLFWSEAKSGNNARSILRKSIQRVIVQLVKNDVVIDILAYLVGEVDAATLRKTAKKNNDLSHDFNALKEISEIKMLGVDADPSDRLYQAAVNYADSGFSFFIKTMKITQEDFLKNYRKVTENGKREVIIVKKSRYLLSKKHHQENLVEKNHLNVTVHITDQIMDKSYYFLTKDVFIASSKKIVGVLWGMIDNKKFSEMCKSIFYSGSHFSRGNDLVLKSSKDALFSDYYGYVKVVVVTDGVDLGGAYPILGQFIKTKKKKITIDSNSSSDISKMFHPVYPFTTGDIKKIRKLSPITSFAYLKALITSRNDDDKKFLSSLTSDYFIKRYPASVISKILHLARTNIFGKNESTLNKSHYRIFYKWLHHNSEQYKRNGFAKNMNFWNQSISGLEHVIHHFQQNFIFVNNNMPYETMVLTANPPVLLNDIDDNEAEEDQFNSQVISDEDLSSERLIVLSYFDKNNGIKSEDERTLPNDIFSKIHDESDIWLEKDTITRIFNSRRTQAQKLKVNLSDITDIHWEAVIGDFKEGDYLVKEMNSFGKVYVESYEMLHCASSFAYSCYSYEYIIFSAVYDGVVQGDDKKPRETIGVNIQTSFNGERIYSIDQIYGKRNESPAMAFRELAKNILKKLTSLEKNRVKKLYTS